MDISHEAIPTLVRPEGALYVPYTVHDKLIYVSGQLPLRDGRPAYTGIVPEQVSMEDAIEAARLCALNVLGWAKIACDGDLSRIDRCLRLGGFVQCTTGFAPVPQIINAASKVMLDVLGPRAEHARIAIGVASLPMAVPVEVEAIFAMK